MSSTDVVGDGLHVVDSSGWIEFFTAGANGPVFRSVIQARQGLVVPTIALYEVCKILSRTLDTSVVDTCLNVMRMGRVVDRRLECGKCLERPGLQGL